MKHDSEILRAIREGENQKVLNQLYLTVLPRIVGYVMKNSGSEEEAKDVFQDAVVIFYKQVKMNQLELRQSIAAYLFTVAKNLWINKAKREQRMHVTDEVPEQEQKSEDNLLSLLITREREQQVINVFNQLGDRCAELLRYVFYKDYSLAEVKEIMGFSSAEVAHTQHYRCKKKLSKLVSENVLFKKLLKHH